MTALYFWYDADHVLLYLGITNDLASRQTAHAKRSAWAVFADHAQVRHFPSRQKAEMEERRLIETQKPLFNRQYNDTPGARQCLVEYLTRKNRLDLLKQYRYGPVALATRTADSPPITDPTGYQHVVRLDGRLVVASSLPGRYLCTARNAKGSRCKLSLDLPISGGWAKVAIPGVGEVNAYNLRVRGDLARWAAQRCEHHWPDGRPFLDPEWIDFDPYEHRRLLAPAVSRG